MPDGMTRTTDYDVPFEAYVQQIHVAGLKSYWANELYGEVVAQGEASGAQDARSLERAMRGSTAYELYGWLERRSQQLKYSGRWGFVSVLMKQKERLEGILARAHETAPERLDLKRDFKMPDYVTDTDTHQLSGGLWRDLVNAYVIAWSQAGLSFSGTDRDGLVDWYARKLKERIEGQGIVPRRVVDLGCTGGRTTKALKRVFPEAEAIGCDVCEPTLRQGHLRAEEAGIDILLSQQNAEALDFAQESCDLIASHWLMHEMPPAAVRRMIAEAYRALRPGGVFAIYDMYLTPGGLVGEWLHRGYAARNNEPYAHQVTEMDLKADLEAVGFSDVRIELTSPEHPGPDMPNRLPNRRLHYMTMISAVRD